jgi:hypothetical protein
MVPSTSGLGLRFGALVMNVVKLSFGNGVGSAVPTVPPAPSMASVKLLFMSWPNA